jgi:DNA-binding response OmpR family regulator
VVAAVSALAIGPKGVIAVCEHADADEIVALYRCGVVDCLLGERGLSEARARHWDVDLRAPAVVVDERELVVSIDGEQRTLTRTQFKVFRCLLECAGSWVSAREIVRVALGTHHAEDSAVVRVHIHGLRRALGRWGRAVESDGSRTRGYRWNLAATSAGASSSGERRRERRAS